MRRPASCVASEIYLPNIFKTKMAEFIKDNFVSLNENQSQLISQELSKYSDYNTSKQVQNTPQSEILSNFLTLKKLQQTCPIHNLQQKKLIEIVSAEPIRMQFGGRQLWVTNYLTRASYEKLFGSQSPFSAQDEQPLS